MPRLLATRWTRFHIGGSAEHPAGRVVDFQEHADLKGPEGGPVFFADISQEEADQLKSDDHDVIKPMGWSLAMTDEEKAGAAKKAQKDAKNTAATTGGAKE